MKSLKFLLLLSLCCISAFYIAFPYQINDFEFSYAGQPEYKNKITLPFYSIPGQFDGPRFEHNFIIEGEINCFGFCAVNSFYVRIFGEIDGVYINGEKVEISPEQFPNDNYEGAAGVKNDFSRYLRSGKNKLRVEIIDYRNVVGLALFPVWPSLNYWLVVIVFLGALFGIIYSLNDFVYTCKNTTWYTSLRGVPWAWQSIKGIIIIIVLASLSYLSWKFYEVLKFEMSGVFDTDSSVYLAIGRAITNGIELYKSIFEIKAPGIFVLTAASFLLFDSPYLMHILQTLVLIIIATIPLLFCLFFAKSKGLLKISFAILIGLLLGFYSWFNAGLVQIESFGAAAGGLAALLMANENFSSRKKTNIAIVAFLILCAVGLKEPFILTILAASLVLSSNIKDWVLKFVYPLTAAIVFGIILLLCFGWFDGYFQTYLPFMLETHVNRHGSPFLRMFDVLRVFDNMNRFTYAFSFAIFLSWLSLIFSRKIILLCISLLCVSLACSVGGEYLNKHFVFAVPYWIAICLLILKNWQKLITPLKEKKVTKSKMRYLGVFGQNFRPVFQTAIFGFLILAALNLPNVDLEQVKASIKNREAKVILEAKYIDTIMGRMNIERYQFLGADGVQVYGWTKHSPLGPHFVQCREWFETMPNLKSSVINNLRNVQIVVADEIMYNFKREVNHILQKDFTEIPWEEVSDIKRDDGGFYRIYFRKKDE